MKVLLRKIRNWRRTPPERQSETHALKISMGAWIPEQDGTMLAMEIEISNIEREMMEIIRDLCERSNEVEFQCSIEEMEEMK